MMSAIHLSQGQATRATVQLFSSKAVSILTFFTGAPTGLLLIAENWRQLGQIGRARRYLIASGIAIVVLGLIAGILGQFSGGLLLPLNIAALAFLRGRAKEGDYEASVARRHLIYRNVWLGIALGVFAIIVTLIVTLAVALTLAPRVWARVY